MNVNDRLREIRLKAGLSVADLSLKVGITSPAVYRIEQGKMNPKHTTLVSWVEACDCFIGIFPAERELLRQLSELKAAEYELVARIVTILPDLSHEHREMYAIIFGELAEQFGAKP